MKDSGATVSQLALLQQKLHSAKLALDEVNEDRHAKLQILLQFIGHLSLACKGQNLELDNKLAKLRHNLNTFERVDEALPELVDVERLLKGQYYHAMIQLEESRSCLARVIRQLQRVNSAPEQLKKEIKYFKQDLDKPFHTLWEYIPKVKQIIGFYETILQQQFGESEQLDVQPKHRQLAHELAQMISEIEFRKDQREQVLVIKEILASEIEIDTLLDAYHTILALLLDNIAREKSASQEFLFALNDALAAVREVVSDSYNRNQRSFQLKTQLNREINTYVDNVGEFIIESNDIVALKAQLTTQLVSIRSTLSRKEALEQRDQALLLKSMETMRKELNELSYEANTYKERLFEQQKLNLLDSLTQLPNRAALEERMDMEYRNYQRHKTPLWVAIADIDHFKAINDSFGHSTGDKTLQVIAMALKNSLRNTEFVARYGGEEFVLLLPDVAPADIAQLLNRVREKVKNIPFKFKNQRITVTVSIGAAQVIGSELIHETFERADAALYKAKHESRDRVVIDV
ncbi:GGDEF domain-containing protein [Shewanella glacialipiscicola]|uniref:diguanylate cyclase n=1 Tax=Shewanella glacialipiscicola TaxID=614069 RepID=A0ABQ6J7B3_9GAMM|nr:GGDEF domain-containing protein [Shewanella glacialipiscicola]MCL1084944.1 diguanylate cyclase [Shewanella glacialipiscicola]GIU13814.1 diguanylate cyclase [Shewanella glacialipiscicola]GMA82817.1 diguanylate cyclase [Shewanella glacialipiscicola]